MAAEPRRVHELAAAAAVVVVSVAAGAWGLSELEVTSDVTHFLPPGEDPTLATVSTLLTDSELTRTWIVDVEAEDRDQAARAVAALEARLADHPAVDTLRSGPGADVRDAVTELYLPRAAHFFRDSPDPAPPSVDELRARADRLTHELGLPSGALVRTIAERDPLLSFVATLDRLQHARGGGLAVHDGRFVTDDGHGILFVRTRAPAFDTEAHRPLAAAVERAFAQTRDELDGPASMEQSAVHRFALDSEERIRSDITRISAFGTAGVLLMLLVLFRSARAVLLTAVPVALGAGLALGAVALLIGRVHGITIAFGVSLVGVAVDYALHAISHHALGRGRRSLSRVWVGVLLGGATTIAGLVGLAWTTFPGLREIAVFASVGVLGALLATRWVVTPLLATEPSPSPAAERVATLLERFVDACARRRGWVVALWCVLLVAGAVGLFRLSWADSLRALSEMDPELLAEDERVRARVSRMDGSRFVLALGDDHEQAMVANDAAHDALVRARDAGELADFRSLHDFLWSEQRQRASLGSLAAPGVAARLDAVYAARGFVPGSFEPFVRSLADPLPPLRFSDLERSPLGDAVRPFVLETDRGAAVLTFVRDVRDPVALARRLRSIEGVTWFDQEAFLSTTYGSYRTRTLAMVVLGLAAVLLLLVVRHRRLDLAFAAFVPALLASVAMLGLLGLAGLEANLMHVIALLLVLSMGVDYGVFVVEHRRDPEAMRATLVSISAACATTVLTFGLLALSTNPALSSLGLALAAGVLLAVLLAPAAVVILGGRR